MEKMVYTDLAVEIQEECRGDRGEIPGVVLDKWKEACGLEVTRIEIISEEGARCMGRAQGSYLTIENPGYEGDADKREAFAEVIAGYLKELLPKQCHTVLVAGLGNGNMTADALGPKTVEKLAVTGSDRPLRVAAIIPGVLAQTGMESSEIVRGIADRLHPDCILTIDALAARSAFRLGNTIQLTDTGIRPGSGVGNARKGINRDTVGVPVIAVGIPTVVSAAAIVTDAMEALKEIYGGKEGYREGILGSVGMLGQEEYYQLISEVLSPRVGALFVMPRDLDEGVEEMSSLLAGVLNQTFAAYNGETESNR